MPSSFTFSLENFIVDQATAASSLPYDAAAVSSWSLSFAACVDSFHDQSGISSTTITSSSYSYSVPTGVRVCSDCCTSTTPLWRSGPQGPKSLCNACGIRQRKARRFMAEAAAAATTSTAAATSAVSSSISFKGKQKKPRRNPNDRVSCKKKTKLIIMTDYNGTSTAAAAASQCYKTNDEQLYNSNLQHTTSTFPAPRDVEEAAFLLMDLSSGLNTNHSRSMFEWH